MRFLTHLDTKHITPARTGNKPSAMGFTLLEVIVAMVVVVSGLVLISQAFSTGLRAVRVSDNTTLINMLAEQKIAELELQTFSTLQSTSGDFGSDYPGILWQEDVATTTLDNLRQVTLTITWTENNATRSLVITKLMADHGDTVAL